MAENKMSRITNVILSVPTCTEEGLIDKVNAYFEESNGFCLVDEEKLGFMTSHRIEANLYVGAFNHLDLKEFIAYLRTIEWGTEMNNEAQLIVKEQDDDGFHIVDLIS